MLNIQLIFVSSLELFDKLLGIRPSVRLSMYLPACLSICQYVYLSVSLCICPPVYPAAVCLFAYLSACLPHPIYLGKSFLAAVSSIHTPTSYHLSCQLSPHLSFLLSISCPNKADYLILTLVVLCTLPFTNTDINLSQRA